MFFDNLYETVDKPCDQPLAYPVHCFIEKFVSLPFEAARVLVQLLGLAVVLFAWAIICVFSAAAVYFIFRKVHFVLKYFFTQTRLGSRIAAVVPIPKLWCCFTDKSNAEQHAAKKYFPVGNFADLGSIMSKVQDAKWVKGVFKKRSSDSSNAHSSQQVKQTPAKSSGSGNTCSPTKLVQRISLGSPKLLSLKSSKE